MPVHVWERAMPTIACPCCGHKMRVPDHLAGRRVSCPRCREAVVAPATASPGAGPLPLPARLGVAALALGLASVLVLCVPVVGYASVALSGAGVALGLAGLLAALAGGRGAPAGPPAGVAGWPRRFGARAWEIPLAGLAACLLALALALLPTLTR